MKEVFRFLELKHKDRYRVYNLCSERSYDISKFHNRVEWFPFDDHNAPPFGLIFDFCKNVKEWLSEHPDNVAVIHCKAGKGRTGLMICAYLVYSQFYASANEAMNFYAAMRTHNQKGVTIPSQIRYVRYFADTSTQIEGKAVLVNPEPRPLLLTSFELVTIPKAAHFNDIRFSVYVLKTLVYTHKDPPRLKNAKKKKSKTKTEFKDDTDDGLETLVFEIPNVPIMGDIRVEFFASEKLFSFWFNTYFTTLSPNTSENGAPMYTVELAKEELDKAHKDKTHKSYSAEFKVVGNFLGLSANSDDKRTTQTAATPIVIESEGRVKVLNSKGSNSISKKHPCELAEDLLKRFIEVGINSSGDGEVHGSIVKNPDYQNLVWELAELHWVETYSLSHEEKTAFWVNIFNLMSFHISIENSRKIQSVKDWVELARDYGYYIGGSVYSLLDIEYGILRNKMKITGPWAEVQPPIQKFDAYDTRARNALTRSDPRINFLISYMTASSPLIRIFHFQNIFEEVERAARAYLQDHVIIDPETRQIQLAKLLEWHKEDFAKSEEKMLKSLLEYFTSEQKNAVLNQFSPTFKEYDWTPRRSFGHFYQR
eukprot:TRINITY_DN2306_c0_g1_i2.p1 TRINITY_DN2306_c0_g1~~TRINITY_DN2306_c0_g1_i2.p1  ORF type:complete len:682 (+),score=198.86 TRINITY_DN2306_c0_g1_i2:262-2046(+)